MSTALVHHHHHRSHLIAGAAALAVVAAIGVILGVTQDDSPGTGGSPQSSSSVPQFRLTGGTHETGNWAHAGTVSGGHVQLAP
jgi:hypothetical protein